MGQADFNGNDGTIRSNVHQHLALTGVWVLSYSKG